MKIVKLHCTLCFVILILGCNNIEKDNKEASFKTNLVGNIDILDPQLIITYTEIRVIENLFEGLFSYDSSKSTYIPRLAKSWNISKDRIVYTFQLRDNLVWSDGVPITAEEIKESFIRILNKNLNSVYANMIKNLIHNGNEFYNNKASKNQLGLKAIDDRTLEITLRSPKPYFLKLLSFMAFSPVPVHTIEKYGTEWTKPENMVVSGAYKIKEIIKNEKIILEKNKKYYDAKNVQFEKVEFILNQNQEELYGMYLKNQIDLLELRDPKIIAKARTRRDYYSGKTNGIHFYTLNTEISPLNNSKLRQALNLAIDRKTLTNITLKNGAIPTRNITPCFTNYSYGKDLELFNKERAKELLKEAGYPNGKGIPALEMKYRDEEEARTISEFIKDQWKTNLNIEVKLIPQTWEEYFKDKFSKNFTIMQNRWIGDYIDPMTFFNIFTKESKSLYQRLILDPIYDILIDMSDYSLNKSDREEKLRVAEYLIVERDIPIIPLLVIPQNYLFKKDKYTNWTINPLGSYPIKNIKFYDKNH